VADYLTMASQNSIVDPRRQKFGLMAQEETLPREAARVRKVVQISTMVHEEKDWAFIALCDDGSLLLYHGSWSRRFSCKLEKLALWR
jgi:hypothetical protein